MDGRRWHGSALGRNRMCCADEFLAVILARMSEGRHCGDCGVNVAEGGGV